MTYGRGPREFDSKETVVEKMSAPAKSLTRSKKIVLGSVIVGAIIGASVFFFATVIDGIAFLSFLLGSIILAVGYYHLVYVLPKMAKDMETRISIEALRVSFWLVIFGLIIIVLGILHLMGLLPPPGWRP